MEAAVKPASNPLTKAALYIAVAGLAVAAAGWAGRDWQEQASRQQKSDEPAAFAYGPKDFASALQQASDAVALGTERIERRPGDWTYQESYARALMGRARLTMSFDDLSRADKALQLGMSQAPYRSGPLLTAAVNNMTIHHMAPVREELRLLLASAVPPETEDKAEAIAIGGDIDFYSGRYGQALKAYNDAARLDNGPGVAVRMANWYRKAGRFDDANTQLDYAVASNRAPGRQFYANILLQKGVTALVSGDWDGAASYFSEADKVFPGYWLIKAHSAQMMAASGDIKGAERAYLAILAHAGKPVAMPEVMDALAALYRTKGDAARSRAWATRAGTIWSRRLAALPEAAYGHVLEHELVLGDPAKALQLAYRNMASRPYGDSAIMLGWALLANGKPLDAARTMEGLNRTEYQTAQQYVVLTQAMEMLGRSDDSDKARQRALDLNPRAFDPGASFIWFGNH